MIENYHIEYFDQFEYLKVCPLTLKWSSGEREPLLDPYIAIEPAALTVFLSNGRIRDGGDINAELGIEFHVPVSEDVRCQALAEFLESDEFLERYDRIVYGYSETNEDGRVCGQLTDDATAALNEIKALAEDLETLTVWEAERWLNGLLTPIDKHGRWCRVENAVRFELDGEELFFDEDSLPDTLVELQDRLEQGEIVADLEYHLKRLGEIAMQNQRKPVSHL